MLFDFVYWIGILSSAIKFSKVLLITNEEKIHFK